MDDLADLYKLLGVKSDASPDTIIKAFRKKSLLYHPDKNGGCEELMKKLNKAKETLLDPDARAKYNDNYESDDPVSEANKVFLAAGDRQSAIWRKQYDDLVKEFRTVYIIDNMELLENNYELFWKQLSDLTRSSSRQPGARHGFRPSDSSNMFANVVRAEDDYNTMKTLLYAGEQVKLAQHLSRNPRTEAVARLLEEVQSGRDMTQLPNSFRAGLLLIKGALQSDDEGDSLDCYQQAILLCPTDEMAAAIATVLRFNYVLCAVQKLKTFLTKDDLTIPQSHQYIDRLQPNPGLKMIRRYEKATLNNRGMSDFEKAMLYIDLSMAAGHIVVVINNFVLAAVFLENSMRDSLSSDGHVYACHNLIARMTANVLILTKGYLDPSMAVHSLKQCYLLLRRSVTHLRRVSVTLPLGSRFALGASRGQHGLNRKAINVVNPLEEELLKAIQNDLLKFMKVCPVLAFPLSLSGDLIFLDLVGTVFLEQFYQYQVEHNPFHPYNSLHYYYLFEASARRGGQEDEFQSKREEAMKALLEERSWNLRDVERFMQWPVIRRDVDGWWDMSNHELELLGDNFDSVEGISIDTEDGSFELLFSVTPDGKKGAFNMEDVMDVFSNGITSSFFTLDQADLDLHYQPFQQQKYAPKSLKGTNYLGTLLHADYLLKILTTGSEVSTQYPFLFKNISGPDGLLGWLPPALQKSLSAFSESGSRRAHGHVHRFWIEAGECKYFAQQDGPVLTYSLGRVPMLVKKHLMRYNAEGLLIDDDDSEDDSEGDPEYEAAVGQAAKKVSPELEFARLLTKHYDELGAYFPVLLRLRELLKLGALYAILRSVHGNMKDAGADIRQRVTEMLRRVRTDITYPVNNEAELDRFYHETLRKNAVTANQVSFEERRRVKSDIRAQLQEADDTNLQTLTKSLADSVYLTAAEAQMLPAYVERWLRLGDEAGLNSKLVDSIKAREKRKQVQLEKYLDSLGIRYDQEPEYELTSSEHCSWVPAAFRKNSGSLVYGGVNLGLKLTSGNTSTSADQTGRGEGGGSGGGGRTGGGSATGGGEGSCGSGRSGGGSGGRMHGNNLNHTGKTYVYQIYNTETRTYYKIGITKTELMEVTHNGKTTMIPKRAGYQAAKLTEQTGQLYIASVRAVFLTRRDAYIYETNAVARGRAFYKNQETEFLPGNKRPVRPETVTNRWPDENQRNPGIFSTCPKAYHRQF